MEDKKLKKKLAKIPDADKNGDPIYKIADVKDNSNGGKADKGKKRNIASPVCKTVIQAAKTK